MDKHGEKNDTSFTDISIPQERNMGNADNIKHFKSKVNILCNNIITPVCLLLSNN